MVTIMEYVLSFVLVLLLISPLYIIYRRQISGKKVKGNLITNVVMFFVVCLLFMGLNIGSTAMAAGEASGGAGLTTGDGIGLIAAALATGLSCIGGGVAVASSATAALGALSENDKIFGKALIFVAMAEGVALYGMLISFQILSKIG